MVAVAVGGTTLADPVRVRADLEGNLPALVTQALDFVREHRDGRSNAALSDREEEYPEAAVREAPCSVLTIRRAVADRAAS